MTSNTGISRKNQIVSLLKQRNFNTLQILKGALYLTWGATLLFAIATISSMQSQRYAIKTVGKDAVPSVLNAQRIKDSLADMGANAVNQLLVKPGENPEADKGFEERREKLGTLLVNAADNITYGEQESKPIINIVNGLTKYMLVIQQARDANSRGDSSQLLNAYYEAVKINQGEIQPQVDALNKVNLEQLETTYNQQTFSAVISTFFVAGSGFFLMVVLVGNQIFLYRRMRRILNPMLVAATVISFVFISYALTTLASSSGLLKVAKEDAFTSLYALRQSRALAYGANRDESRYLLDTKNAVEHEKAFQEKIDKIIKLPPGETFESIVPKLSKLAQREKINGLTGLFGDAWNNITFEGEDKVIIETIAALGKYVAVDKQIRELERSGKHIEAIKLCTGDSNVVFERFKEAHQKAIGINQAEFDKAIAQGLKIVDIEITTTVAAISIAVLTSLGMQKRIKEYEV
jgi:hypothetical protein